MPEQVQPHRPTAVPDPRLLRMGIAAGVVAGMAALLWGASILAALDTWDMSGPAVGTLIGGAVTSSCMAMQLVLHYRGQAQTVVGADNLAGHRLDAERDLAALLEGQRQMADEVAEIRAAVADLSGRVVARELGERIDAGPPQPTVLRPRNAHARSEP